MPWIGSNTFPATASIPRPSPRTPARTAPTPQGPGGSYDAIRVYLWAGMIDSRRSRARADPQAVPAMSAYLANHDAPPEKVSDQGIPVEQDGPVGFSAAVLPYLRAFPDLVTGHRPADDSPERAEGRNYGIVWKGHSVLRSESRPVCYWISRCQISVWPGGRTERRMEAPMRLGWGAWKASLIVAGCLMLDSSRQFIAQKSPPVQPQLTPRAPAWWSKLAPLKRAAAPDMAVQIWQQILLSDPNNTEALAGVARDYKLMGNVDKADAALTRLRRVNPNDPNIAKIEAMPSTSGSERPACARPANWPDRAATTMPCASTASFTATIRPTATSRWPTIKPSTAPPPASRKPSPACAPWPSAIPAIRVMPSQLGIMLTYDPRTRAEGIRILAAHHQRSRCAGRLRQALIWDAANPASAAELRDYLKTHPQDTEISQGASSRANPSWRR